MAVRRRRRFAALVLLVGTLALSGGAALAQPAPQALQTNESDILAAMRSATLNIDDPVAVFAFVLGELPERVQVFPTENYYYFRFIHDGVPYAGNIRLAAANRDRGEVSFAYSEAPSEWNDDPRAYHAALGAADGVTVERIAPLDYRISLTPALGGRSVVFALNDLSRVKPPSNFLGKDETFLGPIFDESGIRFFLVFNTRLKIFHYLLDETVPTADRFFDLYPNEPLRIGKRTGFAFYEYGGRKFLVGVDKQQSWLNSYFDGPFDQLPENFIEGDALRDAIVAADPRAKGKIDRLGNILNGAGRYLIHPYLPYRELGDLAVFHRCATAKSVPAAERARCFVIDNEEAERPNPRPLALKKR